MFDTNLHFVTSFISGHAFMRVFSTIFIVSNTNIHIHVVHSASRTLNMEAWVTLVNCYTVTMVRCNMNTNILWLP